MTDRSPTEIAEEWIAAWSGPEPDSVAENALDWELPRNNPEVAWLSILEVLARIGADVSDRRLAVLAAGPLEDLMDKHGEAFIDRIEAEAHRNSAFAILLGGVWRSTIPHGVWERMGAVAKRGW